MGFFCYLVLFFFEGMRACATKRGSADDGTQFYEERMPSLADQRELIMREQRQRHRIHESFAFVTEDWNDIVDAARPTRACARRLRLLLLILA